MMKAGEYYVGDLCYVMNPQWSEVCDLTLRDKLPSNNEFNLANGVKFAMHPTAYGDGVYCDDEGNDYGVDSGTIGCICADDIDDDSESKFMAGGHMIDFELPFKLKYDDGLFIFQDEYGRVMLEIDTNSEDEYS